MDIIRPDNHTFSLLQSFVEQYEEKCVLLCSHIRRHNDKVYMLVDKEKTSNASFLSLSSSSTEDMGTFINTEGKTIDSVYSLSDIKGVIHIGSTLFHCIPDTSCFSREDCEKLVHFIKEHMNDKKVKCISGESKGTSFLAKLCELSGKVIYQENDYKIMTMTHDFREDLTLPSLSDDDKIIRCTEKEVDELFNIQRKYLQDEVAPRGREVNDLEVKMTLRQILKHQLCLALFSDGLACSKANTNAIGINWVQIGGVYTHPFYRRNGYALHLVYTICKRALKVNKKISLFVKEKNQAAIELYNKLGFTSVGLYKIVYF